MSYASDKLYNGYLRKNMARIVTKVKPRDIIIYLPCLTDHDRENIEAKNDFSGSFEAMKLLLSCMKRRENWPEQFIAALEECEHETMAAEIRAEYDKLRGINHPSTPPPAAPAANVVTAHVHPAPSASHLPDPMSAASVLPIPSEARETNPIKKIEKPTQSAPVAEVITPPEPLKVQAEPQTQAVVVPPVTPPPSPELTRDSNNPVDVTPLQEPEENLEPNSTQDISNEMVNIPQMAEENLLDPVAAETQNKPRELDVSMELTTLVDKSLIDMVNKPIVTEPEPVTVLMEDPAQSTTTLEEDALSTMYMDNSGAPPFAAVSPGRSASPMTNLDDLILTPEKPPVQETCLKEVPGVVPVLEETPAPQNTQVVKIAQETVITPSPSADMENSESGSVSEEDDIVFSKPGVLMSVVPPNQNDTTISPPSPDPMPYSGDSGRLEMSEVEESAPSCQENGIGHNKMVEDVSESPAPALEEEDVEGYVGHVAEEHSFLNKEMHTPLIEYHEQPTKEITSAVPLETATILISDASKCTKGRDLPESPAHRLDVVDFEENIIQVVEQPSILRHENQTPLIEDAEKKDTPCPNDEGIPESPASSLDMEDVRENVGHVAEEPSVFNLEVQTSGASKEMATAISNVTFITNVEHEGDKISNPKVPTPIIQVNGEKTKEISRVPATNDNHQTNDLPVEQKLPNLGNRATNRLNTRYMLTAAGVGACALLIAWRFKH